MSTNLIGPDGRNYVLDNEDPAALNDALSQGFKQPIAPREKSDLESAADAAAAGVTGAVEGVTGGGLGAIAGLAARPDRSGFVDPAALQGKKELKRLEVEQPVASTIGELGGALASPLNAVGALVEGPRAATAAARLGQKVLGGAAVGSLYGAGNAVSEVANGDPDLTADKVLAHIGLGALLGSAGAGVGTALEEGVAGVLPKLARSAPGAQSSLEEFANDRWLKAAGGIQSEIKKIPAAEHGAVADVLREHLGQPESVLPRGLDDALSSLEGERGKVSADVLKEAGIADTGGLEPTHEQEEARKIIGDLTSKTTARLRFDREQAAQGVLKQLGLNISLPHDLSQEDSTKLFSSLIEKTTGQLKSEREQAAQAVLKQLGLDVKLPHDLDQEGASAAFKAAIDKHGEDIGNALKGVDASAAYPGGARPMYSDVFKALDNWESALPDPAARDVAQGPLKKAREYLAEMAAKKVNSPENGFRALNSLKTSLARDINYGGESSAKVAAQKQIIHVVKEQIDQQLERNAGAGVSKDFTEAKRAYGLLSRGEEALGRKTSTAADAISEMAKSAGLKTPEAEALERLGNLKHISANGGPTSNEQLLSLLSRGEEGIGRRTSTGADAINEMARAKSLQGPERQALERLGDLKSIAEGGGPTANEQLLSRLSRAESALNRKASTGADAIGELARSSGVAPPSLSRFSAIEHGRNLLRQGIDRTLGNRWLSASDYLTGIGAGVMHGGPMGALTGLATSVAHKFMRENGAGVIAKLADRLAASPVLSTVAKSFAAQLPVTAPKLGTYAPALLNAAATSPEAALATHMTLARVDPTYAATAQLNGLTPEKPDEHLAALVRAHHIAEAGAAAAQTDKAIDRHIERIIKGLGAPSAPASMEKQDFGNKRMRRDTEASHEQRVKEVRELAADPNALLDRIAGNTAGVPPAVASAMSARAATAVQYLAQAAAVPPKGGPLAHEWTPTEADMHDFAQKLEVVERPLSVLEHAASGMMTEQQADALKAVYPGLAKDITDKILMRLADAPSRVPYGARLVISILSGIDPDGTFSQEAIAANQASISASGKKAAPGSSGSPKHADKLTLAARTATPSEKRDLAEE